MNADKPYRLIYSLKLDISPPPNVGPQLHCQLIVPLNRDGNSTGRNGRPRPPKLRSIDLRIGDDVMSDGTWRRVFAVEAYREHWLTEEEAAGSDHGQGYLYRVPVVESAEWNLTTSNNAPKSLALARSQKLNVKRLRTP